MLSRYRQHVARTSNLLPGNMLPSTYMLTATCCSFGCKRGLTLTFLLTFDLILIGVRGFVTNYSCCKFGDCNFSVLVLPCGQTNTHNCTYTQTQLNALLSRLSSAYYCKPHPLFTDKPLDRLTAYELEVRACKFFLFVFQFSLWLPAQK